MATKREPGFYIVTWSCGAGAEQHTYVRKTNATRALKAHAVWPWDGLAYFQRTDKAGSTVGEAIDVTQALLAGKPIAEALEVES